jgi:hypothetical protein
VVNKSVKHGIRGDARLDASANSLDPRNDLIAVGECLCRLSEPLHSGGKWCAGRKLRNGGNDLALRTVSDELDDGDKANDTKHYEEQ